MYFLAVQISNVVDLVLIAVFLIFAIVGLVKGFWKQIIALVSSIGALVVAYLFCERLATLIYEKTPVGNFLTEWIIGKIGSEWNVELSVSQLTDFIASQNWPTFLSEAVISAVEKMGVATVNFAEIASATIVKYILVCVCFFLISLLARLVFFLIEKLLSFIIKHTPLKVIDKLLGFILGAVKCFLVLTLIVFVVELIAIDALNGVKEVLHESSIVNFLIKYNPYSWLIGLIFK